MEEEVSVLVLRLRMVVISLNSQDTDLTENMASGDINYDFTRQSGNILLNLPFILQLLVSLSATYMHYQVL